MTKISKRLKRAAVIIAFHGRPIRFQSLDQFGKVISDFFGPREIGAVAQTLRKIEHYKTSFFNQLLRLKNVFHEGNR
jgi:hypothetical protein